MTEQNPYPVLGVGAVVFHQGRVLLVKRATPPNQGEWAIPGGKVRFGETLQQAAEREILEETAIVIRAGEPIYAFDLIQQGHNNETLLHYAIVDLRAEYLSGSIRAGDDAADVDWFSKQQLDQLSLNAVTRKLLSRFEKFE